MNSLVEDIFFKSIQIILSMAHASYIANRNWEAE